MSGTNYDEVAPSYDQRYQRLRYPGTDAAIRELAGDAAQHILELGCGTGHWLERLASAGHHVTGLDRSRGMLDKARAKLPASVRLVEGQAEHLPFDDGRFDRVLIVNALHHFHDAAQAIHEARRVLNDTGVFLCIGLDPAQAQDEWCIYDYFPGTLEHDRARYPSTEVIRGWLQQAGFARSRSFVAERIEQHVPARAALAQGALGRHTTSQLSELSDEAYARGIRAIEAAASEAEARGETLHLLSRLHLFGSLGERSAARGGAASAVE